jgi:hypothetical protein
MVCLPKAEGGLGVLKLQTQNEALLLKNLHKFFNRLDIPWVLLIWLYIQLLEGKNLFCGEIF